MSQIGAVGQRWSARSWCTPDMLAGGPLSSVVDIAIAEQKEAQARMACVPVDGPAYLKMLQPRAEEAVATACHGT